MPSALSVTPYALQDADWVARAHIQHYRDIEDFDASFEDAVAAALADFAAQFGRDASFGLIAQDCDRQTGGSLLISDQGGGVGRIRLFLLMAAMRGKGMGAQMLQAALEQAQNAGMNRIEVSSFNTHSAACRLYLATGFKLHGQTPCWAFGKQMVRLDFTLSDVRTRRTVPPL